MKSRTKQRFHAVLPWLLTIALLGALAWVVSIYRQGSNPFEAELRAKNILTAMNIHFLEAVEAEKNAVLAITDEASQQFAAQARQATERVEHGRKDVEALLRHEKRQHEVELLTEFNACWSHYKELDETVLNLATQNTNSKAQRISATQCADEMALLETHLNGLIQRNMQGRDCNQVVPLSYAALTAALKIFSLHKVHIEEPDDRAMDQLEQRMHAFDESARNALRQLHDRPGLSNDQDLQAAEAAYGRFIDLTGEVIKLSRMNTNIKSAELSLGKKRVIAAQCLALLGTLKETVQAQGNYALPRSKVKTFE